MPGINVTTAVRTGPVGIGDIIAGQWFVVGETERGDLAAPTLCRSFSDYVKYYGDYQAGNLYQYVKTYFDEGGTRCYVQRVLGASSATATKTLDDASGNDTITFTAKNAGQWGNKLAVQVVAADVAGFRVKIYLNDVEIYMTRDLVDVTDAINVINSAPAVSHLIVASDDTTSSANPAVVAKTALATGANGTNPATDAEAVTALGLLAGQYKSGAVSLPGRTGTTVWDGLVAHAQAYNRIAICAFGTSTTAAQAKTAASAYYSNAGASYMGFYFPHVKVPAPSSSELASLNEAGSAVEPTPQSSTVTIDPSAYVAAARTRAIEAAGGPWRVGAGSISSATTITDMATAVTPADGDLLDEARINALRKIGNQIRVYGARSASNDEANWRFITLRDSINYIVYGCEDRMEQFVFNTIDGRGNLFGRIRASLKAFLDPMRIAGGLYEAYDDDGNLIDPGYSVVVNSTNNPNSQLATGLVKASVGVRVSGVADLIEVEVTKSNLTAPIL